MQQSFKLSSRGSGNPYTYVLNKSVFALAQCRLLILKEYEARYVFEFFSDLLSHLALNGLISGLLKKMNKILIYYLN